MEGDGEDDLYNDLYEDPCATSCQSCEELRQEVDMLKREKEELLSQFQILQEKNVASEEKQAILVRNISCIFKTAQLEIRRKDNLMNGLRTEKENLELRLQEYSKNEAARMLHCSQQRDFLRRPHTKRQNGGGRPDTHQLKKEMKGGIEEREVLEMKSVKVEDSELNGKEFEAGDCPRDLKRRRTDDADGQERIEVVHCTESLVENRTNVFGVSDRTSSERGGGQMQGREEEDNGIQQDVEVRGCVPDVDARNHGAKNLEQGRGEECVRNDIRGCSPEVDGRSHRAKSSEQGRGEEYRRHDRQRGCSLEADARKHRSEQGRREEYGRHARRGFSSHALGRTRAPDEQVGKHALRDDSRCHKRHEDEHFIQDRGGRRNGDVGAFDRKGEGNRGRQDDHFGRQNSDKRMQKQENRGRKRPLPGQDEAQIHRGHRQDDVYQGARRERMGSLEDGKGDPYRRKERVHDRRGYVDDRSVYKGNGIRKVEPSKGSGRNHVGEAAPYGPGGRAVDAVRRHQRKATGASRFEGFEDSGEKSKFTPSSQREETDSGNEQLVVKEPDEVGAIKQEGGSTELTPDIEDGEMPEMEEGEIL